MHEDTISIPSDEDSTRKLHWICEALIPTDPDGITPSALESDVPNRHLPRALAIRSDLAPGFFAALARLPSTPPVNPLQALRDLGNDDFSVVSKLIVGAYFLDPKVNASLGHPGQEAIKEDVDYDEIFDAISRVIERGPRYVNPLGTGDKNQNEELL